MAAAKNVQGSRKKERIMKDNIVLRKGSSVDDMSMDALFGGTISQKKCGEYTCLCKGIGSKVIICSPNIMVPDNPELIKLGF